METANFGGPLEVRDGSAVFSPANDARPYSVRVADCLGYQADREAYARLFAAAPELLAVLRDIVAGNNGQPRGVTVPALDAARAAIAKAEGTAA
jgi:hypothetical protein